MSEQRHRTVIEIGVDDRQLRQLGQTLDKSFSSKPMDAFEKSLERAVSVMEKLVSTQTKLIKGQEDVARRTRAQQSRGVRGGSHTQGLTGLLVGAALGTGGGAIGALDALSGAGLAGNYGLMGRIGGAAWLGGRGLGRLGTGLSRAAGSVMQEGFIGQMLSGIPVAGPFFQGAIGGAMSMYQSHVQRATARSQAYGATGLGQQDYGTLGMKYGLGPTGIPPALAAIATAAGIRGRDELQGRVPMAMDLAHLGGIDYSASGGFMRATGMSALGNSLRNAPNEMGSLAQTISAALAAGIEESQLGQVLENLSSTFEDLQTRGFRVQPSSLNPLMRSLGGLGTGSGFGGMAGMRAAMNLTEGVRRVGSNPQDDLFQMLLYQTAGLGSNKSLQEAKLALSEHPEEILPAFLQRLHGMIGNSQDPRQREALAELMQQGFGSIGATLSPLQAQSLANLSQEQLTRFGRGPEGTEEYRAYMARIGLNSSQVFGAAEAEAGFEERRANTGGDERLAGAVRHIRTRELEEIARYLPGAMDAIDDIVQAVGKFADDVRASGLGNALRNLISPAVSGSSNVNQISHTANGVPTDWASGAQLIATTIANELRILVRSLLGMPTTNRLERNHPVLPSNIQYDNGPG